MITWSRNEIEYVLRTAIECGDREYAAWLIEQALQKAWDHELKVDWYNTKGSTLAQWDAKYNPNYVRTRAVNTTGPNTYVIHYRANPSYF